MFIGKERGRQPRGRGGDPVTEAAHRLGGDDLFELGDGARPVYLWLYGTTLVEVEAVGDGTVTFQAYLVHRPTLPSRIAAAVSGISATLPMGRIVLDEEGDLLLRHELTSGEDAARLEGELGELCRLADRLDDLLCQRVGGATSLERFRSEVIDAIDRVDLQARQGSAAGPRRDGSVSYRPRSAQD